MADAGVFAGSGQTLRQVTTEDVQLVSIDVTMGLGRDLALLESKVAEIDRTDYWCTFVLRNRTAEPVNVQVGFPVDSQFATRQPLLPNQSRKWVSDYGFIARDEEATYHVKFIQREPKPHQFSALFVWKMQFAPNETRTLDVQYHVPISLALASTRKQGFRNFQSEGVCATSPSQTLDCSVMQFSGYITETGSSWAGNVEAATFTVITDPFEYALNTRGLFDDLRRKDPTRAKQVEARFPVRHPWWFRQITPDGWQKIEGGVRWQYKNFKPKEAISVTYYLTQFPRLPEEVGPFVEAVRGKTGANLPLARELLLAIWGKEPESDQAKASASRQVWYAPNRAFQMSGLTESQAAILREFDAKTGQ
jgi:hypothetical protein